MRLARLHPLASVKTSRWVFVNSLKLPRAILLHFARSLGSKREAVRFLSNVSCRSVRSRSESGVDCGARSLFFGEQYDAALFFFTLLGGMAQSCPKDLRSAENKRLKTNNKCVNTYLRNIC